MQQVVLVSLNMSNSDAPQTSECNIIQVVATNLARNLHQINVNI